MDHYERQEKKRESIRRLGAQRRRAGELRRRVFVTSLVAFVLLWAVVFAQMATGNDPVLGEGKKAVTARTSDQWHAKARAKARASRTEAQTEAAEEAEAAQVEAEEAEIAQIEAETAIGEEPEPVVTSQS